MPALAASPARRSVPCSPALYAEPLPAPRGARASGTSALCGSPDGTIPTAALRSTRADRWPDDLSSELSRKGHDVLLLHRRPCCGFTALHFDEELLQACR